MKLRPCLMNVLGSAILAFGLYNIHSFSGVTEGGVLGLTLLFSHWFHISPAISGFIMNAICYLIGSTVLGKRFIIYSAVEAISFSVFYAIFEQFPPLFPQIAYYPIYAAILGAVFVGIGAGLCILGGGATGGDDAIAMSLSKLTGISIKWVFLISDVAVLALSLTYIPLEKILYSLVTVVLSGQIIGFINDLELSILTSSGKYSPRNVLVGTLRNTEQLEICLNNRFYHIPTAQLTDVALPVKYIAIYQSNRKFGKNAGIRYFGEIEDSQIVSRHEISEIPKNSNERYHRFNIKKWNTLARPIASGESDFVKLTTTRFLLENSNEVPELMLRSGSERRLYLKIRDCFSGWVSKNEFSFRGLKISFYDERMTVRRGVHQLICVTYDEFKERPISVTQRIMALSR